MWALEVGSNSQPVHVEVKESSRLTLANNVTSGDLHELAGRATLYQSLMD